MAGEVEHEDTVAFVFIKTEPGMAKEVAQQVSTINQVEEDNEGVVTVRGVRWADVITGPYDVIAAVRVQDNRELGELVVSQVQMVTGVKNPLTMVMISHHRDGTEGYLGQNGHP